MKMKSKLETKTICMTECERENVQFPFCYLGELTFKNLEYGLMEKVLVQVVLYKITKLTR